MVVAWFLELTAQPYQASPPLFSLQQLCIHLCATFLHTGIIVCHEYSLEIII
jgi:hypothetical protein